MVHPILAGGVRRFLPNLTARFIISDPLDFILFCLVPWFSRICYLPSGSSSIAYRYLPVYSRRLEIYSSSCSHAC